MPGSNILVKRDAVLQKCPDCKTVGSIRISRSRNLVESIIKRITFLRIYRCKQCGWRGYKSTHVFTYESFKTLMLYIAIALICGIAVRMIIKRFL